MPRFCTYFDSNYLLKGLALHRSLQRHAPGSELTVLCLDDLACRTLERLRLPGLSTLPLAALEEAEPRLAGVKSDRTRVEYYFTCTSSFVRLLIERGSPGRQPLTYVDADLWFFSDVSPVLEEFWGNSLMIVPHRFPPALRHLESHGVYNVGWITFADDAAARECLSWWSDRCIEWCYDRVEEGRFADQKYLDVWPTRFRGVRVLSHPGAGVAPWNVAASPITVEDGRVHAAGAPLVFFHFAGFKRLRPWLFDPGLASYGSRLDPTLRRVVYEPYLAELRRIERMLREKAPEFDRGWGSVRRPGLRHLLGRMLRGQLMVSRARRG